MSAVSGFDPDERPGMRWNSERLSDGYVPEWDVDLEQGRQGELFIQNLIESIAAGRIEVKTDAKSGKTGNVFIEVECKGWPSGIQTSKSEYWAFVLPGDFSIIAKTDAVRDVAAKVRAQKGTVNGGERGSHPTKGVLVPLYRLLSLLRDVGDDS
jgi:hypothetical protein